MSGSSLSRPSLQQNNAKKKHLVLWVVIGILSLILAAVIIVIAVFIYNRGNMMTADQKEMLQYLETKYSSTFVVDRPIAKGSSLGVKGYLQAQAESANDGVKFSVYKFPDIDGPNSGLRDDYQSTIWQNDQKTVINDLVSQTLKDTEFKIRVMIGITSATQSKIGGTLLTYDQAKNTYAQDLTYHTQIDFYVTSKNYSTEYVDKIGSGLQPLIGYLYHQGVGKLYLVPAIHVTDKKLVYSYELTGDESTVFDHSENLVQYLKQTKEY